MEVTSLRQVDLYNVLNAVLYVLRTGSWCRQLLHDFPNWQTVYGYFHTWAQPIEETNTSLLDALLKKLSIKADCIWGVQYKLYL